MQLLPRFCHAATLIALCLSPHGAAAQPFTPADRIKVSEAVKASCGSASDTKRLADCLGQVVRANRVGAMVGGTTFMYAVYQSLTTMRMFDCYGQLGPSGGLAAD